MFMKRTALAVLLLISPLLVQTVQPSERAAERLEMVREQIAARGVNDPATLQALREVPRHLFVPPDQSYAAYADGPLPIGYGQTISQPYIVAAMTELVRPGPNRKFLEVGTGSGYQAAVLVATGAEVYSIELIPQLARYGQANLARAGYPQVRTRSGDGYYGWPEAAPFDGILVTAAAEAVPPPLLEQLADGGRMVIPVGSRFFTQTLLLVEKRGGKFVTTNLMPVRFVPFRRAE